MMKKRVLKKRMMILKTKMILILTKMKIKKNKFIPDAVVLKDQIININHYLDNHVEVGTPFSSNKIKHLSKKCKENN